MDNISWSVSYLWHRILCRLEEKLGSVVVAAWLDHTEVIALVGNQLILKEADAFRRELLSRRVHPYILEAAKDEFNLDIEVVICEE